MEETGKRQVARKLTGEMNEQTNRSLDEDPNTEIDCLGKEETYRETDFYPIRFLAEHRAFQKQAYLFRMGKTDSKECRYCGDEDTPKHTVFEC